MGEKLLDCSPDLINLPPSFDLKYCATYFQRFYDGSQQSVENERSLATNCNKVFYECLLCSVWKINIFPKNSGMFVVESGSRLSIYSRPDATDAIVCSFFHLFSFIKLSSYSRKKRYQNIDEIKS